MLVSTLRSLRGLVSPLLVVLSVGACSAREDTIDPRSGGRTTGGVAGGAGGSAGAGPGTPPGGTGGIIDPGNKDASTPGADAPCARSQSKAEPLPVDMHIMQDKSGSMMDNGKWTAIKQAVSDFVNAPDLKGLGVGLAFFGRPGDPNGPCSTCTTLDCLMMCGCTSTSCTNGVCRCTGTYDSCSAADYILPSVEIRPLPDVANDVIIAYNGMKPEGSTPSRPALEGAIEHAKSWSSAKKRRTVVIFATDGVPAGCDTATNNVQGCAMAAAAGVTQGVLTFVIGVGTDLTSLNAVAQAGGTGTAFIVDGSGGPATSRQFIEALKKIQTAAALACTYVLPAPPPGEMLDPGKVNVEYTTGNPPTTVTIPNVPDKASCGTSQGWYYDNPTKPTQIVMCDTTCSALSAPSNTQNRQLDIVLGCKTVVLPPPK